MEKNDTGLATNRRAFLGTLATGAAAMSLGGMAAPLQAVAKNTDRFLPEDDPDAWFKNIKGKHRIVFDATEPNGVFPFAWPRVFLITNSMTGTPDKDNSVVVILRHEAMPFALNSELWAKYKFGDMFKVNDEKTKASAMRNAFYKPAAGDFQVPGIGNVAIGINELQDSGVMFCVCNMAMTVYSAVVADMTKQSQENVYKEFKAAVLPKIQIVPSGVWAVGRAQEHGCAYCKA
ncbi:twin-arginine translocation signal domain-containing protein [Flavisolibacter ginsenosidimutans]|uniref:Twin-arginine translocation signal domain-containing protein n=1 Tax=Flavisolibacter ginsenosidimutans TaxID=661481 RepID=A0A5B8ULL5_9BACT|nr:twin-arginine translocation signal domain-containing protein [Flavisolibacter ginsenosidimutans]QEC57252.1 twin-arginine translocation signal domain-containing protein [Flavisolibacter ginsenosidimutans]